MPKIKRVLSLLFLQYRFTYLSKINIFLDKLISNVKEEMRVNNLTIRDYELAHQGLLVAKGKFLLLTENIMQLMKT